MQDLMGEKGGKTFCISSKKGRRDVMRQFKEELIERDACEPGIDWVGDKTLLEAWDTCERADWMIWLSAVMIGAPGWSDHKEVVSVCCDIAESVLHLLPTVETGPKNAMKIVRQWIDGEASIDDVRAAAAYEAAAGLAAYATAYAAADAAAYAAYYAADAADAAADAAYFAASAAAAYEAATWEAYYAAKKTKHKELCQMIRLKLKIGEIV